MRRIPARPARAMVLNDAPQPVEPHVFIRGNPGRPGKAVPRRFLRVLAGPDRRPFQEGQRPARAGPGDRRPQEPADGPGAGQPRLALALRQGAGHHAQRLRPAERPAQRIPSCSTTWPPSSSPTAGRSRRCTAGSCSRAPISRAATRGPTRLRARPREPAALAVQPPAARFRVDARLAPGRLRRARSRDRRAGRSSITEAAVLAAAHVYGFIDRQNLDGLYRTFDFAVPDATSPRRFVTTVPQQALFLMNSPFLHEQARRLAASIRAGGRAVRTPTADGDPPALSPRPRPVARARRAGAGRRVPPPPDRPDRRGTRRLEAGRRRARPSRPLSPWEQLGQVLLLTNEFMFVD